MSEDGTCPLCGGPVRAATERRSLPVGRWSAHVDVSFDRCDACDEDFLTSEQARSAQLAAAEIVRAERGIISPERIRGVRGRYGLTQADLERMLDLGEKTVVRWERGTVLPGAAANTLLIVLESQPQIVTRLAAQAGVKLRPLAMLRYADLSTGTSPQVREAAPPAYGWFEPMYSIRPGRDWTWEDVA